MAQTIAVDRDRWLGFRWQGQGLGGAVRAAALDDLLLLGVQGGRGGGPEQSLIQRTATVGATPVADAVRPDGPLVTIWSMRGAPHAHPLSAVDLVCEGVAPVASDEGGTAYLAAVDEVAAALTAVVTAPMTKAEASAAVAARVRADLVAWCERCRAEHVPDGPFRAGACRARIVLDVRGRATLLQPAPAHPGKRTEQPRVALVAAYFRVNGPAARPQLRDWLGSDPTAAWQQVDDLVRVRIAGHGYELPEALLDAVRTAPRAEGVALVPPNDGYLRQVDRELLVPDRARRRAVWRALSAPGAVLSDGEVIGTWRYRRAESEVAVTCFERPTARQRADAERSAALIAQVAGAEPPALRWS
ncbi:DNA glycosylase AlkZ-like family protein [Nocardia barduliensis]|uniref:DNA glycosylase AlkZ-like family protein n=1 Tax=Nocardia barduliensis TaxID=2736643 RepID=UPI0015735BB1|nr:crosslink repair DNA glycosylase YcaQ family protein [Nocardia barduliensis]